VAGIRTLRSSGVIGAEEQVVAVLTGHLLKDPGIVTEMHQDRRWLDRPNQPVQIAATISAVRDALAE
jgi:threonine synthase